MGDLIQTSDILGAELLCGYQYFDAKNMLNEQKRIAQEKLSNLQNKKTQVADTFSRSIDLTQMPEVQTAYKQYEKRYNGEDYDSFRESQIQINKREIESDKYVLKLDILWFVLTAICSALFIVAFIVSAKSSSKLMLALGIIGVIGGFVIHIIMHCNEYFVFVHSLAGLAISSGTSGVRFMSGFWGCLLCPISAVECFVRMIIDFVRLIKNKTASTRYNFWQAYKCRNPFLTIKQFVEKMSDDEKSHYYRLADQENINKKVALVEQQIQEQRLAVQFVENQIVALENEGLQIVKDLTEIPAYYFQEESILQMLFFYVNKRADNVKELINLYEQTVFQEELLGSLNSISVSIDRLANVIDNNFRRLGLQLGVINESINANTKQLVLNKSKLAQIQDESSRNYIQTVEHINNVEKIITEQLNSGLTVTVKS